MIAWGANLTTADLRMLQRTPFSDLDELNGIWSREDLLAMNDRFVRAVFRALAAGHESPVVAAATIRIGRNESRRLAEEAAIRGVWRLFVEAKFDMTAAEVMERVRAVCPDVTVEQVRAEFRRRLFGSNGVVLRLGDGPEEVHHGTEICEGRSAA